MKLRYFGTDGIRGKVNGDVINPEFLKKLGFALGKWFQSKNNDQQVSLLIGRDTRESGEWMEVVIGQGLADSGVAGVIRKGILPTPALSFEIPKNKASGGIMITASHNPASDNGVKILNDQGMKLSIAEELEIEEIFNNLSNIEDSPDVAQMSTIEGDLSGYISFLASQMPKNQKNGITDAISVDLANGATTQTAKNVFDSLGLPIFYLGDHPNGLNINDGVGSECTDALCGAVRESNALVGFAFDGDGDRIVVCDEKGELLNGDELLGIFALDALSEGKLKNKTLVTTIQSNLGLDRALAARGGSVVRVDVGDRNVLHKMLEINANLGGENSGHIIFADDLKSGDGVLAASKFMSILLKTGKKVSELKSQITLFPQVTKNLKVKEKRPFEDLPHLKTCISLINSILGNYGRVLVRYSGTEAKIRLLIEGERLNELNSLMDKMMDAVRQDLEVID